jgi:hypothetical protein
MKRVWYAPLLLALTTGCVELNPFQKKELAPPPPVVAKTTKPTPVQPEQIHDNNAHEKAEALRQELDFEEK